MYRDVINFNGDKGLAVLTNLCASGETWEKIDLDQRMPISFTIGIEELQSLVDAIYKHGIKPQVEPDPKPDPIIDPSDELSATKIHLEDMRRIVFESSIERKPQKPITIKDLEQMPPGSVRNL